MANFSRQRMERMATEQKLCLRASDPPDDLDLPDPFADDGDDDFELPDTPLWEPEDLEEPEPERGDFWPDPDEFDI